MTALSWFWRGWSIVPIQPNTKSIVKGFGLSLNRVDTLELIDTWFMYKNINLGVIVPSHGVILDFDLPETYQRFIRLVPDLADSYTESTPGGGAHVFLLSESPIVSRLDLVPGIEVLSLCLVYPSIVGGKGYDVLKDGEILRGDVLHALESFFVRESDPYHQEERRSPYIPGLHGSGSKVLLQEVKAKWGMIEYLNLFEPDLRLSGRGRWLMGLCPWHDDHHPSLWIDQDRNLWGCHACGAHGDVINWHARRLRTSDMAEAARDLAIKQFRGQG